MKNYAQTLKLFLTVIVVLVMVGSCTVISSEDSSKPLDGPSAMNVWGQAYLDEVLLPEGELITAWIDGTQYGDYITIADGWFSLNIDGDWTETLYLKEGGVDNDLIIFEYIDGNDVYYANKTEDYVMNGFSMDPLNLYFNTSIDEPAELKIDEVCTDDGVSSQFIYLYNPSSTAIILDDNYFLQKDIPSSTNGYEGTTMPLSGIIGAGSRFFVNLDAIGFLDTLSDELKLVWNNTGLAIADSNNVTIDRVEYGNQDMVPDNTTLLDATAPPSGWSIKRIHPGQDTNDCSVDFQLYDLSLDPPAAPTNLTARLTGVFLQNITLEWNLSADDGAGDNDVVTYDIYRAIDDCFGIYQLVGQVPAGSTSWTDIGTGDGDINDYFYFVEANDTGGLTSTTEYRVSKFMIDVSIGWNLVSIPVDMEEEDIITVLQTVDWTYVQWYDSSDNLDHWKSNSIDKPDVLDDLWNLNHSIGIWLNVNSDDSMVITGRVRVSTTIPLYTGWNLVGYPSFTDKTVENALTGTTYDIVEGFNSSAPYRISPLSLGDYMSAGNGYWVHVTSDCDWFIG